MVVFERCDPKQRAALGLKCKTDAEIEDWLKFKYFLVRENGKAFVQHKFEDERIDDASRMIWYPISSLNRLDNVRLITRSDMQLSDNIFNMGDLMNEEKKGYMAHRKPSRELPYLNNFHNSITYEMSND